MLEDIKNMFISEVERVFTEGVGLRGNHLKQYTGPKLQHLSSFAINKVANFVFGENNWYRNGDYIVDPNGYFENQRLDDHLWFKDKIVLAGESRAWMDKPFTHMKYGVINVWLSQPHTSFVTHPKCFFPILVFAQDVTNQTFNSLNHTYRLDNKIKFYNLSGQKRDSKKDYFYRGFSKENCVKYIEDIYNHMVSIMSEYEK